MDVSGYSYFLERRDSDKRWVATVTEFPRLEATSASDSEPTSLGGSRSDQPSKPIRQSQFASLALLSMKSLR